MASPLDAVNTMLEGFGAACTALLDVATKIKSTHDRKDAAQYTAALCIMPSLLAEWGPRSYLALMQKNAGEGVNAVQDRFSRLFVQSTGLFQSVHADSSVEDLRIAASHGKFFFWNLRTRVPLTSLSSGILSCSCSGSIRRPRAPG